ncbi:hypothetical protein [Micromonospora sp. CPCC 206061]|uniref:hypothetical protein n=1 Tax=Micromonospora sp. CPCC 206061 TaxID=3122410 RepID=UPI002FF2498B
MRRFRVWGLVAALFVIASGVAVIVPLVRGAASAGDPEITATEAVQGYACAQVSWEDHCDRISADMARREPVSPSDWRAAQPLVADLNQALVGATCQRSQGLCAVEGAQSTAETVRRAIVGAGFLGPVVRDARITDPAPRGAIMFAVPVGGACLLGYVTSPWSATVLVVGPLRDAGCAYP